MKTFTILLLLLIQSSALGQVRTVDRPELEDQRREYEKYLFDKIDRTLKTTVSEESYVLNVAVLLRRLPVESFEISGEEVREADSLDVQQEAKANDEKNLLPLPKIGIWKSKSSVQKKESRRVSSRIRNFSELISRIKIDLFFNEKRVSQERAESVKNLISSMLSSSTPVTPQVTMARLDLTNSVAEDQKKQSEKNFQATLLKAVDEKLAAAQEKSQQQPPKTAIQMLAEFKDSIAVIFSAILLFALGMIINRRYSALQEKRLRLEETRVISETRNNNVDATEINLSNNSSELEDSPEDKDGQKGGFEQFREIVQSQPERAAYLIKQWLYSGSTLTEAIVCRIPRTLNLEDLNKVLSLLNEADRKQWNRSNSMVDNKFRFVELDNHLTQLIASNLIEPETGLSESARQLVATVTPQEGAACIKEDPSIGALLASVLPSIQYSRILSLLDVKLIQEVALQSESMGQDEIKYTSIKFEKLLSKVRNKSQAGKTAFVERVPELIHELGFTKENALFKSVARSKDHQMLFDIAMDFYPSDLVKQLPKSIMKSILDGIPLNEKAELIYSLQSDRDLLLDTFSEGRLKEVINVELEEIQGNETRSRTIIRSSNRLWQDFINKVRFKLRNDESLQQELEPSVKNWVKKMVRSDASSQESSDAA